MSLPALWPQLPISEQPCKFRICELDLEALVTRTGTSHLMKLIKVSRVNIENLALEVNGMLDDTIDSTSDLFPMHRIGHARKE